LIFAYTKLARVLWVVARVLLFASGLQIGFYMLIQGRWTGGPSGLPMHRAQDLVQCPCVDRMVLVSYLATA